MRLVLVVEDNPTIRESLGDLFLTEGYEVRLAVHGDDARAQLESGLRPSAIVLDLMMPVMDGWQFLEWKAGSEHAGIPVIVLTALSFDGDVTSLQARHGCNVLPKTGSVDLLLDCVRRRSAG